MSSTIRSLIMAIALLMIGLFLATAVNLFSPRAVRADPSVLYAAPAAQGSGNCSGWTDVCTLQTALTNVGSDDEIWVQAGVHYPAPDASDRALSFQMRSGVAIYGGFAGTENSRDERDWVTNVTVLSGDLGRDDTTNAHGMVTTTDHISGTNAYHVVVASGVTETAVLDGFIITAGQADESAHDRGGGMYNSYADPTLANLTFIANLASGSIYTSGGGGMYNYYSHPSLERVTFSGNQASGSVYMAGGAMFNYYSHPTLEQVAFTANWTSSSGGAMYNHYSNPSLEMALFSGNRANTGGGMYNYYSYPTLVNVTLTGNDAQFGGGMFNYYGNPTVTNAIVWGNEPQDDQILDVGSTSAVTYSIVEGGFAGNLDDDPLFVYPVDASLSPTKAGNYRLRYGSPAIDAGNTLSVTVTTDLDGSPRVVNDDVDMGAYEYQAYVLTIDQVGEGEIIESPDWPTYTYFDQVVLTATAEIGWAFFNWSGDVLTMTNPLTLTIVGHTAITATFSEANNPPIFTSTPVTTAMQGELYTYLAIADDLDLIYGDVLTITAPMLPSWLTLEDHGSGTAMLSGSPGDNEAGPYLVVLRVTDSAGAFAEQEFVIIVSEKPRYYIYLPLVFRNWQP